MATRYLPLTLDLVSEGTFLAEAGEAFRDLQAQMIEYVREHGKELATGAKGKLSLALTVQFEGRDVDDYSIKSEIKSSLPARPPRVSTAVGGVTQTDEASLFVRPSGSSEAPPRQAKLCTEKGETIDPETGEVISEATTNDE